MKNCIPRVFTSVRTYYIDICFPKEKDPEFSEDEECYWMAAEERQEDGYVF